MENNNGMCWPSKRSFGRFRNCNVAAWAFFTPNSSSSSKVSSSIPQSKQFKCVLCIPIVGVGFKKSIITYKTLNGISSLQKHLEFVHQLWGEWIMWEKEGSKCGQWPFKKRSSPIPSNISNFFGHVTPFSKDDSIQKEFEKDLTLSIAKELVSLSFVEPFFFMKLILKQNPRLNFPLRQVSDILPRMVELTKDKYVYWSLESCHSCIISFHLWMSKARVDTFVIIVHFLNDQWEPCRIIVRFFEIANTTKSAIALLVNNMLAKHGLIT